MKEHTENDIVNFCKLDDCEILQVHCEGDQGPAAWFNASRDRFNEHHAANITMDGFLESWVADCFAFLQHETIELDPNPDDETPLHNHCLLSVSKEANSSHGNSSEEA